MNENLNLVEILKDCPEGTKLYSPIYGDVKLVKVIQVEDEILSSIEDDIPVDSVVVWKGDER